MKNGKSILSVKVKQMFDDSPDTSYLGEYSNRPESEFAIDRAHSLDCASVTPDTLKAKETLEHAQQTVADIYNGVLAQYNGTLANEKLDSEREALDEAYDMLDELAEEVTECDCSRNGRFDSREYRYFNPGSVEPFRADASWIPADVTNKQAYWREAMQKNAKQDYERMESLNAGNWHYIGIRAEAEISVPASGTFENLAANNPYRHDVIQTITSGGLWGIESDSEKKYLESTAKEELADLKGQLKALGFSARAISKAFKNVEEVSE